MNLFSIFNEKAQSNLDQPVFYTDEITWTYADLYQCAAKFSAWLAFNNIQAGARVMVCAEKRVELIALYLACLQRGIIYVPLNPALTDTELHYFIEDAEPSVLLLESSRALKIDALASRIISINEFLNSPLSEIVDSDVVLDAQAPAVILYTSGTTGKPKGAVLTHAGLLANAQALTKVWRWRQDDVLLHALPIFHIHGLLVALNIVLLNGSKAYFLPKFDVRNVLHVLPKCSVMMGVPTYYSRLLNDAIFGRQHCLGVRLFISGSAPLPLSLHEAFMTRTGCALYERYGMSEAAIITAQALHDKRKVGSVGKVLQEVCIRINNDVMQTSVADVVGEIYIQSPALMQGYWRKPEATQDSFEKAWFKTGDMGYVDKDGDLFIVGRAKEMIISGGLNVYPQEVENALLTIQGVHEVAVFGLPHADLGEAVTAAMVCDDACDEQLIRSALKEILTTYKVPKRFLFVTSLPRNALGKLQKNVLQQQYTDLYQNLYRP
ncbi:MAG: AMP-binding protein [Gammaproteobacteria bacterium]|nr:AMP-binding protein [Gammaproteobacteria bacterium]